MIFHGNQTRRTYAVTFETEIYAENDPYEDCTNYPTQSFLTYEECDKEVVFTSLFNLKQNPVLKAFITQKLSQLNFPLPMWLAWSCPNCSDDITLYENITNIDTIADIFTGLMESNCTKPCNTTKAKTRLIIHYSTILWEDFSYGRLVHEVDSPDGGAVVDIIPDSTVLVTVTHPVTPTTSILMSGPCG